MKLCSQASNSERRNVYQNFPRTLDLLDSEEQEDTENDSDYFIPCRKSKSMDMIEKSKLGKPGSVKKAESVPVMRSRGYSYGVNTKDWHRSSVVNREAELQAKRYSEIIKQDTLKTLSNTISTASFTVEKCAALNNELSRQDPVLSKADTDIAITEYQTDQLTQTLRGRSSLRSKLKGVTGKKEPKLGTKTSNCDANPCRNGNLDSMGEDLGLCALSKIDYNLSSLDRHQIQFNAGVAQLHKALDIMKLQQMDAALALDRNVVPLNSFGERLIATKDKINCQSDMIKKIMRQSKH